MNLSGIGRNVGNVKSINQLLESGGGKIAALKQRADERSVTCDHVCRALPPKLAANVVSAGFDHGCLTVGVSGAPWASRLRYLTDALRREVSASLSLDIQRVRIKVVAPSASPKQA